MLAGIANIKQGSWQMAKLRKKWTKHHSIHQVGAGHILCPQFAGDKRNAPLFNRKTAGSAFYEMYMTVSRTFLNTPFKC